MYLEPNTLSHNTNCVQRFPCMSEHNNKRTLVVHTRFPFQDMLRICTSLCRLQRAPGVYKCDVELAQRFFAALATEPDGIRATVQEAINRLAAAYRSPGANAKEELRQMLAAQSRGGAPGVRACAVAWALEVFEANDPFARHLCIVAAADEKPEVRRATIALPQSWHDCGAVNVRHVCSPDEHAAGAPRGSADGGLAWGSPLCKRAAVEPQCVAMCHAAAPAPCTHPQLQNPWVVHAFMQS